ncbi:MAG: hypothetical protein QGI08_09840 [Paracoccaceae bacterium]|jgi:chromosome segregation ATPase|nr:hypothetical protein [Paracoccaceae bacterium]MDP7186009.1 hypothetical protein [Paracoccaceae bacterium]
MFRRKRHVEEGDGESIFVSMTDLTVSMLMIVIVLLGFFASQMKDVRTIEELERTKVELEQSETFAEDTLEVLSQTETEVERLQGMLESALRERTEYRVLSEERALVIADRDAALQDAAEAERRLVETLSGVTNERNAAQDDAKRLRGLLALRDQEIAAQSAEITRRIGVEEKLGSQIERLTFLSETQATNVGNLQQALAATSDELDSTVLQLEDTNKAKTALEGELREADALITSLNRLIDETKAALAQAQQVNQAQTALLETVFAERDAALTEIATLTQQAGNDAARIAGLDATVQALRAQVASLETAVADGTADNENATAQIAGLDALVAGLRADLAALSQARDAALAQVETLSQSDRALRAEIRSMTADIAGLEQSLSASVAEATQLASALAANEAAQKSTTADLQAALDQIETFKQERTVQDERARQLQTALRSAESRISSLTQEMTTASDQIAALKATLETTEASLAITNQARDAAQSAADDRQAHLNAAVAALEKAEIDLTEVENQTTTLVLELETTAADRDALKAMVEDITSRSTELSDELLVSKDVSETRRLEIILLKNARRSAENSLTSANRTLLDYISQVDQLTEVQKTLTQSLEQLTTDRDTLAAALEAAQQEILSLRETNAAAPTIQPPRQVVDLCDIPETAGFDDLLGCIGTLTAEEAEAEPAQ